MTTDPIHDIRKVVGSTALLSPRLVHKRTPSEVLVGDYRRRGDEARFTLAIPPTHRIVPVGAQTPSPILLLEAARQAGIAATHLLLGVPSEWTFVPKAMAFSWLTEPTHFPDYGPLELCAVLWVEDIVPKNGRICELAVCTSLSQDGSTLATATGRLTCMSAKIRRLLRRRAHLASSWNTRTDTDFLLNVRTEANSMSADIGWDYRDRFQFDHDADHVPGMHLFAAAYEAHRRLTKDATPQHYEIYFTQFAELDGPVHIHAEHSPGINPITRATITQFGHNLAKVSFRPFAVNTTSKPGQRRDETIS